MRRNFSVVILDIKSQKFLLYKLKFNKQILFDDNTVYYFDDKISNVCSILVRDISDIFKFTKERGHILLPSRFRCEIFTIFRVSIVCGVESKTFSHVSHQYLSVLQEGVDSQDLLSPFFFYLLDFPRITSVYDGYEFQFYHIGLTVSQHKKRGFPSARVLTSLTSGWSPRSRIYLVFSFICIFLDLTFKNYWFWM